MPVKRNPAPLATGDRAGSGYAEQPSLTRLRHERQVAERRLRRQHLARQVHRLGGRLAAYAGLDQDLLRVVGGDLFAAGPVRAVEDSR